MHCITLDGETDFDGWRNAARALALNNVSPSDVTWGVHGNEPELFEPSAMPPLEPPHGTFNVPAKFVELAQAAILHRDRRAVCDPLSPAVAVAWQPRSARRGDRSRRCAGQRDGKSRASRRAQDARLCPLPRSRPRDGQRYIAWFEPEHHIVELAAPFFARRFADMPWSILTPDVCAHWDGHAVSFTPGVARPRRRPKTGWRKPGGAITPASSIRPG